MAKYLLANLVSGDAEKFQQKIVRDLSARFDTHWLNDYWTPAHCTLKNLFDSACVPDVERILENFAPAHTAHPIEVRGMSIFPDAVLMNIRPSGEAMKVYLELIEALRTVAGMQWDRYDGEERLFHMSVALFDIDKHFDELKAYAASIDYRFEASFDNIALLEQHERGWILRRYFALQK